MLYVTDHKINVQQYKKLLKVSDDEIVFLYNKKTVFICGNNLSISYFEKDEFEVLGTINNILFE